MNETDCEAKLGEGQLTWLGKAKSLYFMLKRGLTSGSGHAFDHELPDQGRMAVKCTNPVRIREGSSANVNPVISDSLKELVADEVLVLDFQADTSAEEYFNNKNAVRARGTFHSVEAVRWEHEETDWILEEVEFTPHASPADKPPTLKEVCASVVRVRDISSARGWLSPKSSRALAKLGDQKIKLDRSEENALNYLLGRCANISELTHELRILLKVGIR